MVCGYICNLRMFVKNDFLILLLTFWLSMQSFTGIGFAISGAANKSRHAFMGCIAVHVVGEQLKGIIDSGMIFGRYKTTQSISLDLNVTSGNYTLSDEAWAEAVFSFLPTTIFLKNIQDLNEIVAAEDSRGLRLGDANSYCTAEDKCFWHFSIASCWGIYILHYLAFSLFGIYFDNTMPDAMGVKKHPLYFLDPNYWGLTKDAVKDVVEEIKDPTNPVVILNQSTDPDVVEEERLCQHRIALGDPEGVDERDWVVEVRGLTKKFVRTEKGPKDWVAMPKPFWAVKAPWFSIGKGQLFALLGPNGAGKTTTINMLTGFMPATSGNAVVLNNSVRLSAGMSQIRKRMGVCAQFDTLWDGLTAREHLLLFGAVKGLAHDTVPVEAQRLLEEVRLTDAADVLTVTFSGGMRRRLSVAVALIGSPDVVYLDEPTTGMDPINRRHVWDLIEKTKQDRTIILTTHSMEEADILGDRIGIMAKGRLRCLGSSVRLKSRFGKGYRVSVSFESRVDVNSTAHQDVKALFKDSCGAEPEPEMSSYLHFHVPSSEENTLIAIFSQLEQRKTSLGILDVQISMSSLEDVFLKISKDAEHQEAVERGLKEKILLGNGEQVEVIVGVEEFITSPKGRKIRVTWTTDEEGKLIVGEVIEDDIAVSSAQFPDQGMQGPASTGGKDCDVSCEFAESAYVTPASASVPAPEVVSVSGESFGQERGHSGGAWAAGARGETELQTQASALFRKNIRYQAQQKKTNCCLLFCPLFFVGFFVLMQFVVGLIFLDMPFTRCVYCGPDDAFSKQHCLHKNCTEYFVPPAWFDEDTKQRFIAECQLTAQTCGGGGNFECFKPSWNLAFGHIGQCPSKSSKEEPVLRYAPPPTFRAPEPVLYTGSEDTSFVDKVAEQLYSNGADETKAKMVGAQRVLVHSMYQLLTALPLLGCDVQTTDATYLSGVCKLMQEGTGRADACCTDLSNETLTSEGVIPKENVNFWSLDSNFTEARWNAEVMALGNNVTARQAVKSQWEMSGVRFGEGMQARKMLLELAYKTTPVFGAHIAGKLTAQNPSFSCVKPSYVPSAATVLGGVPTRCMRLEEGVVLLADALNMSADIMPKVVPKSVARWAQACRNHSDGLDTIHVNVSMTLPEFQAKMATIPCGCRWLSFIKRVVAPLAFPAEGWSVSGVTRAEFHLPKVYDCPKVAGEYKCVPGHNVMHLLSIPGLKVATPLGPHFPDFDVLDPALTPLRDSWWVRDDKDKEENSNNRLPEPDEKKWNETAWLRIYQNEGRLSLIVDDCAVFQGGMCFFDKLANLSATSLDCISAKPTAVASKSQMQQKIYDGVWKPYASKPATIHERVAAYDFANSNGKRFNITLMYNNTLDMFKTMETFVFGGLFGFTDKRQDRFAAFISDGIDAFVNANMAVNGLYVGSMRGLKSMPMKTHRNFDFDVAQAGTPAIGLTKMIILPFVVSAVMHEKEKKIRMMMQMMGLTSSMYWFVTWLFYTMLYLLFDLIFYVMTVAITLPNGYQISIFSAHEGSVVFVFMLLAGQHTVATAFLISALWGAYPNAEMHARIFCFTFLMFISTLCYLLIDWGGAFMGPASASNDVQNIITLFPYIGVYRGLLELSEYAYQAKFNGTGGLTWAKIADTSEGCGMGAVLTTLFLETLAFHLTAWYLDLVVDTGMGVPRHPLFFLGYVREQNLQCVDPEATAGEAAAMRDDVQTEAKRVKALLASGDPGSFESVMMTELEKIYPAHGDQPPKVAVKTLTMAVRKGECFGMLGPNGAGKTTSITCLTGLAQPTSGDAYVGGLSIRSHMAQIYKMMGVCPQHDILWDVLTASEHMEFYGALKHLKGPALKQAVIDGLRDVSLLNWKDQKVSSFSGGMKRRLSVAISMIGSPTVCYLDEPSTGLDPASRRALWKCVKKHKHSRALFLTTHSMEEAEELCDRIGIFVDGSLRCIDAPKALAARFGGFFILTVTTSSIESAQAVTKKVLEMCHDKARITYALGSTQKFEIPVTHAALSKVFTVMTEGKQGLGIEDWGIASATLEETFLRLCQGTET